jgi:hypothetical protein
MLSLAAALILLLQQQPPAAASEVDPGLRAVVERFFETQQAEDLIFCHNTAFAQADFCV